MLLIAHIVSVVGMMNANEKPELEEMSLKSCGSLFGFPGNFPPGIDKEFIYLSYRYTGQRVMDRNCVPTLFKEVGYGSGKSKF